MNEQNIKIQLAQDVVGQCVCQKVREVARKITRAYDDALRPTGIKANQFTMLSVIALTDGLSLTMLADKIGVERTTMIRNLKPLEREKQIEIYDQSGTRARSAKITGKGLAVLQDALPLWREAQDALKDQIGESVWVAMQANMDALGMPPSLA